MRSLFSQKKSMPFRVERLNAINPGLRCEGRCHFAAIEAAIVLLDPAYEPHTLLELQQPAEHYRNAVEHALSSCELDDMDTYDDFSRALNVLQNNELFIVGGEAEIDHAYVLYKKNDQIWLIDADRQIYQPIHAPEDYVHNVSGWLYEYRDPQRPFLNYLGLDWVHDKKPTCDQDGRITCAFNLYHFNQSHLSLLQSANIAQGERFVLDAFRVPSERKPEVPQATFDHAVFATTSAPVASLSDDEEIPDMEDVLREMEETAAALKRFV